MKLGRIYIYKNKHYYFVKDKRKIRNRLEYTIAIVKTDGSLGSEKKTLYKRADFKLTKIKPDIYIPLPKIDRNRIYFLNLVDRAIELAKNYKVGNKKEIRFEIAKLAYSAIFFQNGETGEPYNLRDFAKAMGFKRYTQLYRWVGVYMKFYFTDEKFSKALPKAADHTLVKNYDNLNRMWGSLYGYDKNLNKLLKLNLNAYVREMKSRNIYLR